MYTRILRDTGGVMEKIQQVKEALLQESETFISFLKNGSGLEENEISTILGKNRSIFEKLQEVLAKGDETDKKEAIVAFARVMESFGDISNQIASNFGLKNEMLPKQHVKMMSHLGRDLGEIVRKSI